MLTMRKILCRVLLCLCLVLALAPVPAAYAQDLDRIESYDVDVTPDTQDGSLRIQVTLEWTVLAEGPVSWVKIGVPNGSIREETALTDNIDRLNFDNSYMYVYFDRDYNDGETFRFSYSWVQEYMYALEGDTVSYDYTPRVVRRGPGGADDPDLARPGRGGRRRLRRADRRRPCAGADRPGPRPADELHRPL